MIELSNSTVVNEDAGHINAWTSRFAWHPIKTLGGRLCWLKRVERRWNSELNVWCDGSGFSGVDGGWEYRLPLVSWRSMSTSQ